MGVDAQHCPACHWGQRTTDENGELAEAYQYDSFGGVQVHKAVQAQCEGTGDGVCNLEDYCMFADCYGPRMGTGGCAWANVYGSDDDVDGYASLLSLEARPVGLGG